MNVTLDLDPAIRARAEARAAREGLTLVQLVERMLVAQLADADGGTPGDGREPPAAHDGGAAPRGALGPLPVFERGTGGSRDIDWLSNASIYAAMYEEEDERVRRWASGESPEY